MIMFIRYGPVDGPWSRLFIGVLNFPCRFLPENPFWAQDKKCNLAKILTREKI